MKEEDLSLIKRYPIMEYLERRGIRPVRKTPAYAMYRSPLTAQGGNASEFQSGQGKEPLDRLCRRQGRKHNRPLYAYGGMHAIGSYPSFGTERFR